MEEAIEELKTAKTELATAKTELATAKTELATAKTEYDKDEKPSKKITDIYNRAREDVTRCSNTVNSIRAYCVTLNNTVLSLSAAAAPGKFER